MFIFICLFALDLKPLKEECEVLNEREENDQFKSHGFITGEKSFRSSQTEKIRKKLRRLEVISPAHSVERVSLKVETLTGT